MKTKILTAYDGTQFNVLIQGEKLEKDYEPTMDMVFLNGRISILHDYDDYLLQKFRKKLQDNPELFKVVWKAVKTYQINEPV